MEDAVSCRYHVFPRFRLIRNHKWFVPDSQISDGNMSPSNTETWSPVLLLFRHVSTIVRDQEDNFLDLDEHFAILYHI